MPQRGNSTGRGITRGRGRLFDNSFSTPLYSGEIDFAAIGQKLRAERERIGKTQEQVAEVIGITPAFVGHIERAERSMSLDTLIKFCSYYHVTIDYLLSDTLPPDDDNTLSQIADILKDKSSEQQAAILDVLRVVSRHV